MREKKFQHKVEGQVYNVRLLGMVILLTTLNYSTPTFLLSSSFEIPEKAERSLIPHLPAGRDYETITLIRNVLKVKKKGRV